MCDPFWKFFVSFFGDVRSFSACDEYSLYLQSDWLPSAQQHLITQPPPSPPAPYPATLWPYFGTHGFSPHPNLAQQMTNILDDPHHPPPPHSLVSLIFHNVDFSGINQANDVVGSSGRRGWGVGAGEQWLPMKRCLKNRDLTPNRLRTEKEILKRTSPKCCNAENGSIYHILGANTCRKEVSNLLVLACRYDWTVDTLPVRENM
jgi:hypothetical protein